MKKSSSFLLIGMVLVLVSLSACGGHLGRSHGSRTAIQNETHTDVYTYDLPGTAKTFTLDLKFTAVQGNFHWTVTDPEGQTAWEGSLESPGNTQESKQLPLVPGQWTLNVRMEQASGSYDIEWQSR